MTVSFTPVLAPMPRGILATVTARPARDARRHGPRSTRPTRTSRSCTCCPRALARDGRRRIQHLHLQPPSTTTPGGPRDRRPGQPRQGCGRSGHPERQPDLGLPRRRACRSTASPQNRGGWGERLEAVEHAVSVTGPRLPGGRCHGRPQANGERDVAVVVNDGPPGRGRRVHPQPGQGGPGALDASRCSPPAGSARSSSTPAGPTPAPARGFPDTHPTAERSTRRSTSSSVGNPDGWRGRGLLDRPDR